MIETILCWLLGHVAWDCLKGLSRIAWRHRRLLGKCCAFVTCFAGAVFSAVLMDETLGEWAGILAMLVGIVLLNLLQEALWGRLAREKASPPLTPRKAR